MTIPATAFTLRISDQSTGVEVHEETSPSRHAAAKLGASRIGVKLRLSQHNIRLIRMDLLHRGQSEKQTVYGHYTATITEMRTP